MGVGASQAESFNPREQAEPNRPTEFFDTVGNRLIHLVEEVKEDEGTLMFPCDIRESLSQAMNLTERGFIDTPVVMPNGRKLKAAQVVRMFRLDRYMESRN